MIATADLERRLSGLEPIGLGPDGTTRLAWTPEDAAAAAWFAAQAAELGLRVERDPAGSLWACPDSPPPWWAVGSHLDSVPRGGRFDGALGVVAAFEVAARTTRPVAVLSFADEEGGRFNTPTFGSRALVGRMDVEQTLGRADRHGVTVGRAMAKAGIPPGGLGDAPSWLPRLRGMLELHIDQSRDVVAAGAPAGVVRALASRVRLRVDFTGRADHAGTTRRAERRDALAAAARLIVRADELAGDDPGFVVTAGRILVTPNALTTVPAEATVWLDARAPAAAGLAAWRASLAEAAAALEAATGVTVTIGIEAQSDGIEFDGRVREALARAAASRFGSPAPDVVCYAGHDAGVIGERLPAGMVLVRNETGISHAPEEHVELEDAAAAADVLVAALEELTGA